MFRKSSRQWIQFLPFFLTVLVLAGCGENSSSLNHAAIERLSAGDTQGAELLLKKALEIDPVNKVLIGNLGEVFFRTKNWDGAINLFQKAQSIQNLSGDKGLRTRLAEAHIMNGELSKAFSILQDLAKENPKDEYLLFLQGMTSSVPAPAIKSLKEAIQLKPDRKESYLALARAQAWQGDIAGAREILEECKAKAGGGTETFPYEVALYLRDNDIENARKAIENAPEAMRDHPMTQLFRAYLDLGDRKVTEARAAFESLADSNEVGSRAKLGAALCMLIQDDPNLAIEMCEEVVQANPNEVVAHTLLGLGQLKRLQKFLAKKSLETSLDLNPDQPAIRALVDRIGGR